MEAKVFEYTIDGKIPYYVKEQSDFIEIPFRVDSNVDVLFIEFSSPEAGCKLGIGVADSTGYLRGWSAE
ncbi:MAG: hypothetical protein QXP12_08680, partial [Ignisphaera sp.]